MRAETLPNLRALLDPFFERHYVEGQCWKLVVDLLHAGGFVHIPDDPLTACHHVQQVWWRDDPRDPLTLVQPWDWYLIRNDGHGVDHPTLVVDPHDMIHVHRKAGVCIEPLRRYRHRLMQIARLRCLY